MTVKPTETLPAVQPDQEPEHFEACQPLQPGSYWRYNGGLDSDNLQPGLTYLVMELKCVENNVHTVVLHFHPGEKRQWNHDLLVDEFLSCFEVNYDYKSTREQEIAAIHQEIADLQQELLAGQTDPSMLLPEVSDDDGVDLRAGLPAPGVSAESGLISTLGTNIEGLEHVKQQAHNQAALAKAQSNWIKKKTGDLSTSIAKLSPFFQEQAACALAACSDAITHAENITQAVKTMDLYVGNDVVVDTVRKGAGADPQEKVWLFQRKLFLDEELAINLADGGADFSNFPEFCKEIEDNPEFLERLIPAQRGIVAIQYRRYDKHYSDNPFVNAQINQENQKAFLLVRDGQNVYRVSAPLAVEKTRRLFPTKDEDDRPFRGFSGDRITLKSVRFVDAHNEAERIRLHYKRLLILLCGLHDRGHLLGDFALEQNGPISLFRLSTQKELFHFVCDDDDNMIASGRPSWSSWVKQKNSVLQSGSRVVCLWHTVMTPQTTAAFVFDDHSRGYNNRYSFRWNPVERFALCITEKSGPDLVVQCPVNGYSRTNQGWVDRNAHVKLNRYGDNFCPLPYLCLDDITAEEVDYYIHDRREREDYLDYLQLLCAVREILQDDEKYHDDMGNSLRADLLAGGLIEESQNIDTEIGQAIRSWRAKKRGKKIASPGSKDFMNAKKTLLANLYVSLGQGKDRVRMAEELARQEGRVPLRLVLTGSNQVVLYATMTDKELLPVKMENPWVQRIVLKSLKSSYSVARQKGCLLPNKMVSEQVLKEWPEAAEWQKKQGPEYAYMEKALSLIDQGITQVEKLKSLTGQVPDEEMLDFMDRYLYEVVQISGEYVKDARVSYPVGIVRDKTDEMSLICLEMGGGGIVRRFGSKEAQEELYSGMDNIYVTPDSAYENCKTMKFSVGLYPVDGSVKKSDGFTHEISGEKTGYFEVSTVLGKPKHGRDYYEFQFLTAKTDSLLKNLIEQELAV